MIAIAIAAAAATAFASPASPTDSRACARIGTPSSARFYPVDDHTILISAGLRAYRVTTQPTPLLADNTATLLNQSRPTVCVPADMRLRVVSPTGEAGLIVQNIEELSSAQANSLRHGGPSKNEKSFSPRW